MHKGWASLVVWLSWRSPTHSRTSCSSMLLLPRVEAAYFIPPTAELSLAACMRPTAAHTVNTVARLQEPQHIAELLLAKFPAPHIFM